MIGEDYRAFQLIKLCRRGDVNKKLDQTTQAQHFQDELFLEFVGCFAMREDTTHAILYHDRITHIGRHNLTTFIVAPVGQLF